MKFQTILLLVAASTFVLAKPELSEDEVDDTGIMSEPENPIDSISSSDVQNDTPVNNVASNDNLPQEDGENPEDDAANIDVLPQEEGESQENDIANAGEKSDDYEDLTDGAKIEGNEGEGSEDNIDDNTDNINTGNIDASNTDVKSIDTINALDKARNDNKSNSSYDGEKSDDEDNGSDITGIAAGIAGAAVLSSAGIFIWVKKSKRSEVENAPLTMELIA